MGMALSLIGGVFSAVSTIMAANAQANAMQYQAAMAEQNKRAAEMQARESLAEGAREEGRFRAKAEQFQATQQAQMVASGALLSGSPLAVLADTGAGIEEDVTTIRFNALKNMWGYRVQGTQYGNEAKGLRAQAADVRMGGMFSAIGGLIQTGGQMWGSQHTSFKGGRMSIAGGTSPYAMNPQWNFGRWQSPLQTMGRW